MADTLRTLSALQALLADNTSGDISAQDVRDFLVSVFPTGRILLASQTASSSSSLDFTSRNAPFQSGNLFQSDFDEYEIEYVAMLPATDNANLVFRVSEDGGSTWKSSTGDYDYFVRYAQNAPSSGGYNATAYVSTYAILCDAVDNGNTFAAGMAGVHGSFTLWRPGDTSKAKKYMGESYYPTSSWWTLEVVRGSIGGNSSGAIDSLRFLFSSGNIASGTVRVYGVCK